MHPALLPALALMFNALVFGVSWWPMRELQVLGLHPLWATAFIFVLGTLGLLVIRPGAWRGLLLHPMLWLMMAASGLTNVCFNWAVTSGDVVRAVLLFYLMPAWVVLIAWLLLGERPTAASLIRLVLAFAGLVVVLKTPESPWPVPQSLADGLALMGGVCFALTNVLLYRLAHTPGPSRMLAMFAGGALTSTSLAGAGWGLGQIAGPPAMGLTWLLIAAAVSGIFLAANLALQYGAARLRASTTSIIMLSEVVFASVSSVLLGAGELGLRTLLGGSLILLAVALAALSS
jgi:drug/metabolite transporter (DMT)-like permease